MSLALNLRLQAFAPSIHVCSAFLFPEPPQFLYQAPPRAQQLTLPDFGNVPHFEHFIVPTISAFNAGAVADVEVDARNNNSRSVNGRRARRVACVVTTEVQMVCDIEPDELANMDDFVAFEWTQAAPQRVCLNDVASQNMESIEVTLHTPHVEMSLLKDPALMNISLMSVALDTSHFEMSQLKALAPQNILPMSVTRDTSHSDMSPLKAAAL